MLLKINRGEFIRLDHVVKYEITSTGASLFTLVAVLSNGITQNIIQSRSYDEIIDIMQKLEYETDNSKEIISIEEVKENTLLKQIKDRIKNNINK